MKKLNCYDVNEMPTAQEIQDAMRLDEWVNEIEHGDEVDRVVDAIGARLDRLAVGGPRPVKDLSRTRTRAAGFSLVEIVVGLFLIAIVAAVVVPKLLNPKADATVVACAANQVAIATDIEGYWQQAQRYPSVEEYRNDAEGRYKMRKIRGVYYLVDGDANKGHGNDIDECDEDNPGASGAKRDCLDIQWVIVCDHNHGDAAAFVYTTDQGVPTMVLEGREPPPGGISLQYASEAPNNYQRFINLQWK